MSERTEAGPDEKRVVVQYKLHRDRVAEHEGLLAAVFEELAASPPEGLAYEVLKLADGVSYVHYATVGAPQNPLLALASFKRFSAQIAERCEVPPASAGATRIGRHPRAG